jgi:hypothetical protein
MYVGSLSLMKESLASLLARLDAKVRASEGADPLASHISIPIGDAYEILVLLKDLLQ